MKVLLTLNEGGRLHSSDRVKPFHSLDRVTPYATSGGQTCIFKY